ncbi:MAG: hypothetical protein IT385_00770 [Deltaproteobacteria bacterium]|nr:hypothetical protein [Deltaproteobacteria bacterium]
MTQRRTRPTLLALALPALAFPLAACGDDDADGGKDTADTTTATATDTTSTDTGADATHTPEGCALGLASGMSGTWAVTEVQTALVQVEPFGTMSQVSTSYYLARLGGGATSTIEMTLCAWETEDDAKLFTTTMSAATLASLDPFVRELHIESRADGSIGYMAHEGFTLRGVELTDPATDTMPTEASDARVVDQDEDGEAGISLVISGTLQGKLFVAHRHKAAMDGCFTAADRIAGLTDWTTDQVIFGSNPASLSNTKPVATTHPDDDLSHFEMVKVLDNDDCAAIISKRATLFPE